MSEELINFEDQTPNTWSDVAKDPKITPEQIGELSKLLLDLGKFTVATVVIGYFIPSIAGEISLASFITGSLIALSAFVVGVGILKFKFKLESRL